MKFYCKGLLSLTMLSFLLTSCGTETKDQAANVNADNCVEAVPAPVVAVDTAPAVTLVDPVGPVIAPPIGPVPGFLGTGAVADVSTRDHGDWDHERDCDRGCDGHHHKPKCCCNKTHQDSDQDANQTNNNNQANNNNNDQSVINNITVNGCGNTCPPVCRELGATVTGSGVTISTNPQGTETTGLLEVGFPTPLDWLKVPCDGVAGTLGMRQTFGDIVEGCPSPPSFDNPNCPQNIVVQNIQCLEPFISQFGETVWFSGTILSQQTPPSLIPFLLGNAASLAQTLLQIQQGRAVQSGSLTNNNPDNRSLFFNIPLNLTEGVDNPVLPIGFASVVQASIQCNPDITAQNLCKLREQTTKDNSNYQLSCPDPLHVCSTNPAIIGCVEPTVAPNGIGFANDGSFECYVEATRIQWLTADFNTVVDTVPNSIANLCSPPAGIQYGNLQYRDFVSGGIDITVTP